MFILLDDELFSLLVIRAKTLVGKPVVRSSEASVQTFLPSVWQEVPTGVILKAEWPWASRSEPAPLRLVTSGRVKLSMPRAGGRAGGARPQAQGEDPLRVLLRGCRGHLVLSTPLFY